MNKHRRLRLLDEKLHNGEALDIENFIKLLWVEHEIVIDRRTIQRDIKELKQLLADRYQDDVTEFIYREKGLYKYKEECFAFDETVLIEPTDLGQLLKYNPNFITDMETDLEKKFATIIKEYTDSEGSKINWHPVVYQNKTYEGHKNFTKVLKYINQQIPVEITRQPIGTDKKITKKYLLLLLKVIDNNFAKGWYVLAQKLEDGVREIELDVNNLNLLALDRIVNIRPLRSEIITTYSKKFNPVTYFKHSVKGIMRNNLNKKKKDHDRLSNEELHKLKIYRAPEKVSLVIPDKSAWICKYFEKYPIHTSQFHRIEGNSFYLDLFVEVDMDLENLIYMYSKEIVVLEPIYLKNIIKERLQIALGNY